MIGILVVGHGTFATGLITSLEHLVGGQSQIAGIEIRPNDDMEERRQEMLRAIDEISDGDGVVILTDVFGGTPSNLAISIMDKGKIEVLSGANLPLAIKIVSLRRTDTFERVVLGAQEAGRKYINVASQLLDDARRANRNQRGENEVDSALTNRLQARKPRKGGTQTPRTRSRVGKAIVENRANLKITSTALLLLIEEKLDSLRLQHPNSVHAKRLRDEQLAEYESLRMRLIELQRVAEMFTEGKEKESAAVKAARAFGSGVGLWWGKNHYEICERAFEMGLFLSAVGVCSIVGVGGATSVIIAGALAGGKPVVDALKSTAKSLSRTLGHQSPNPPLS